MIEKAISQRDQTTDFAEIAYDWIQTLNKKICTKDEFVLADELCYQAFVFQKGVEGSDLWIPITCIHDEYYRIMETFSQKLSSKEHLKEIAQIFGYEDTTEFIRVFEQIKQYFEKYPKERFKWSSRDIIAPLIIDHIDSNQLGSYN